MAPAALKIYLVACESSGDGHGAALARELRKKLPALALRGLGGPRMEEAGVEITRDMTKISALGFGDVLRQYFKYRRIFYAALADIKNWKPDALVLIDSPAFNLRLAKKIRRSVPTVYYISPQIWAWGGRRIHTIRKTVSKMLAILPFERPLYEKAGVPCEFVGHPLLDRIPAPSSTNRERARAALGLNRNGRAVGILPGSRRAEIERILPVMLKAAEGLLEKIPGVRFFMVRSSNVDPKVYDAVLSRSVIKPSTPDADMHTLIAAMDFCLVTSGTATLETALAGTPFFLLYKTSWSTYLLAKKLVRVPYLGIVNLLLGRKAVPEFIQQDACPRTIAHEASVLLSSPELMDRMREDFSGLRSLLGEGGASTKAAAAVLEILTHPPKN